MSISKLVTAFALDKALRDAKVRCHFDAPVKDVLPEFELSDKEATEKCTIRDLLGHRTNIWHYSTLLFRPFESDESEMGLLGLCTVASRLTHSSQGSNICR